MGHSTATLREDQSNLPQVQIRQKFEMTVFTPLIGRFGNQLFQYAHARKFCELHGHTLATPPWVGEKIFDIPEASRAKPDKVLGGYNQDQASLIYSRKWCLDTLRLRPEIESRLAAHIDTEPFLAHRRVGDYAALGYPVVSERSYMEACAKYGYGSNGVIWVTEETATHRPAFTGELAFLPDFYRMMKAKALFRGNSSFSYWASVLGEARTFSPCIKGKRGGVESDCEFVEGNHERFCELEFVTDLHLFSDEDRYDYPLKKDSIVIDVGGYEGDFAAEIHRRYGCRVLVFEPCREFFDRIKPRVAGTGIKLLPFALGRSNREDIIYHKGNMTGLFADGQSEVVEVRDVAGVVAFDAGLEVALIKLNCEGVEFEILERILECGIVNRFRDIQCQFHGVVPDAAKRYAAIREGLLKTHRLTYDEPWCWQNFERRT